MISGGTAPSVLGAALRLSTVVDEANAGEAGAAAARTVSGGLQGTSGLRSGGRGSSRSRARVSVGAAVAEESVAACSAVVGLHSSV